MKFITPIERQEGFLKKPVNVYRFSIPENGRERIIRAGYDLNGMLRFRDKWIKKNRPDLLSQIKG